MTKKKHSHIKNGNTWNTFVKDFLSDAPDEIKSDLEKILFETHSISEKNNHMPNVLLPIVRRVYQRNENKRASIKSNLSKFINEIVNDELYEQLLDYDKKHDSLKYNNKGVDVTAQIMATLALKLEESIQ